MKVVAAFAALVALLFIAPLVGTVAGAFSGWVVGLFFSDLILSFFQRLGANTTGLELWHVGGALGFIGGFFRASVTNNAKS